MSAAPMMPSVANSVAAARCRHESTGRSYVRSNSRALAKARFAAACLPQVAKMRASSSMRVGTKCGAESPRSARIVANFFSIFAAFGMVFRAHSKSDTSCNAWRVSVGWVEITQAGNPTDRIVVCPTSLLRVGVNPRTCRVASSAGMRVSGTNRTTTTPELASVSVKVTACSVVDSGSGGSTSVCMVMASFKHDGRTRLANHHYEPRLSPVFFGGEGIKAGAVPGQPPTPHGLEQLVKWLSGWTPSHRAFAPLPIPNQVKVTLPRLNRHAP